MSTLGSGLVACRSCAAPVEPVVDLARQPLGGAFPLPDDPPDELLPLRLGRCPSCGLAQLADPSPPEADPPDAPSPLSSAAMAAHARAFVRDLASRGVLSPDRRVLSLASHGGHLAPLLREHGAATTILDTDAARARRLADAGERVIAVSLDDEGPSPAATGSADLIVDSYLLAHLDRPRVALRQLARLLAAGGTLVLEFDDLLSKVEGGRWDVVGHGHPTYLSLSWLVAELADIGLVATDAAWQPVYGGSVRLFARRDARPSASVEARLEREAAAGLGGRDGLRPLADAVERARCEVVPHLEAARAAGTRVAGYGAPARAITFLNALGIGPDLLPFVVDRSQGRQGRAIPGVRVPIRSPDALRAVPLDEILVLTWNLVDEVRSSLQDVVAGGTRLLVGVPSLADVTGPAGGGASSGNGGMR